MIQRKALDHDPWALVAWLFSRRAEGCQRCDVMLSLHETVRTECDKSLRTSHTAGAQRPLIGQAAHCLAYCIGARYSPAEFSICNPASRHRRKMIAELDGSSQPIAAAAFGASMEKIVERDRRQSITLSDARGFP